eukprot:4259217-Prymnesium_polylepis.1
MEAHGAQLERCAPQVVVDLRSITENLPFALDAMFFLINSSPKEEQEIRDVHASFLGSYHLDGQMLPLLMLDLEADTPFSIPP